MVWIFCFVETRYGHKLLILLEVVSICKAENSSLNLILLQNSNVPEYSKEGLQSRNMPFFSEMLSKIDSEFELLTART